MEGTSLTASDLTDGVFLFKPKTSGTYLQELTGTLGDGTQWWDADNVWLPNQNFFLDAITSSPTAGAIYSPSGWNKIFENPDLASDLVDYHGYMTVDTNYAPTQNRSAIGSRSIVGSSDLQVAAWDYYGHERPPSEVQAGAVQDYNVSTDRTPPPAPDYPY